MEQEKYQEQDENTYSYSVSIFDSLEKRLTIGKYNFEVRKGEMYSGRLSGVFPDCTSSRMWIKQGTKEFENTLLALERWDAICHLKVALILRICLEITGRRFYCR